MSDNASASPAAGWIKAFAEESEEGFGETFAEEVVLEASTLTRTVEGRSKVKAVLAAASKEYESLEFVAEATQGARTYLEWEAVAFGGVPLSGVTVLTKGADGLIVRAAIHHRPLGVVLQFASAMKENLAGVLESDYFEVRP